jgi:hypothetical protein
VRVWIVFALTATAGAAAVSAFGVATPTFVSRGNAICRAWDVKSKKLGAPPRTSLPALVAWETKAVALDASADAQIRALRPPAASRPTFEAMIAVNGKTLAAERKLISATKKHDEAAVKDALARANELNKRSNLLARRIGLTVCAEPAPH